MVAMKEHLLPPSPPPVKGWLACQNLQGSCVGAGLENKDAYFLRFYSCLFEILPLSTFQFLVSSLGISKLRSELPTPQTDFCSSSFDGIWALWNMRSILTVECVGWFGTKEYLSVIFRNSVRQLIHEGINQLNKGAGSLFYSPPTTSTVFDQTGFPQVTLVCLRPRFHSTEGGRCCRQPAWWRWSPGGSGGQPCWCWPCWWSRWSWWWSWWLRRWCSGSAAAWSSGAGCARSTAGRPSLRSAPERIAIVEKYSELKPRKKWSLCLTEK